MRLVVEQGELAGQEFILKQSAQKPSGAARTIIGRGPESDIVLAEQGVSRQHARLQHGPEGWTLTDLGSTNGTSVNRQPLRPHEVYPLRSGDRITIGSSVFRTVWSVRDEQEPGALPIARPARQARRAHPALLIGGALLLVIVLAGIVAVLVIVLRPKDAVATPTPLNQIEQLITALPVPTEFQELVTSVVPLIPTGLPIPLLGGTATPAPGAVGPPDAVGPLDAAGPVPSVQTSGSSWQARQGSQGASP